jgi:hypothetical protein
MIPNRLLLRAATVLALTQGGSGPYPTMANEAVFDTKLKPVTDVAQESMTPFVLIYTDLDTRENLEKGGGRANWKRHIDMIIQLGIGSVKPDKIDWIETDPELEALLDLFELEVEMALFAIDNPWALYWRRIIKCVESWESVPYRSAEQTARYAVRQIAIKVEIAAECQQRPLAPGAQPVLAQDPLIPVPYLADLLTLINGNPVFESTRKLLTGEAAQAKLAELKTIGIRQVHAPGAEVDYTIRRPT